MERKIGEIFEYNGEWYQCVEGDICGECSLFTTECGSGAKSGLADKVFGECGRIRRSDNKYVIFKKLEKVGEPTRIAGGDVQLLRTIIKSCNGCIFYKDPHCLNPTNGRMDCGNMEDGIYIEIKQNKENMEEKSLNLKPFDLEKAKQGKPVCTRDGKKVRIICFDKQEGFPIIALVETKVNDRVSEEIALFDINGRAVSDDIDSKLDLMMSTEKKEGWVNVYRDCDGVNITKDDNIYSSKDAAISSAQIIDRDNYAATTIIKWEE